MPERKLYVGTKLIRAIPLNRNEYFVQKGENKIVEPDEEGYCVEYPDGYISWSPKDVFETAYREVTKGERELF